MRSRYLLLLLPVIAGAAWVWFFPACPFLTLTGLQCPGCGTTRALDALLHGNVATAFQFNPMLFAGMSAVVAFLIRPTLMTRPATAWTVLGVVLAWGVIRNVM